MNDKQLNGMQAKIDAALATLADHFDTVQILCSVTEEGETYRVESGVGNLFSRIYQAQAYASRTAQIEQECQVDKYFEDKYEGEDEDEDDD